MDLLNRFKQFVGMGISMEIEMSHTFFMPGSSIRFNIVFKAEETTEIRQIVAELVSAEARPGTAARGQAPAQHRVMLSQGLRVKSGMPYSLPCSIALPPDAALTSLTEGGERHWSLHVLADVPQAPDLTAWVGFVVAPSFQFEWRTETPIEFRVGADRFQVTAYGTYTVPKPDETSFGAVQRLLGSAIVAALDTLLKDRPELVSGTELGEKTFFEIAGALREIVAPQIRDAKDIPLDTIAALTVDGIQVVRP
jgi:hypothetical protein